MNRVQTCWKIFLQYWKLASYGGKFSSIPLKRLPRVIPWLYHVWPFSVFLGWTLGCTLSSLQATPQMPFQTTSKTCCTRLCCRRQSFSNNEVRMWLGPGCWSWENSWVSLFCCSLLENQLKKPCSVQPGCKHKTESSFQSASPVQNKNTKQEQQTNSWIFQLLSPWT